MFRASSALLATATVALAGCTPTMTLSVAPETPESLAQIALPALATEPQNPTEPISVDVRDGVLTNVELRGPGGDLQGILAEDGSSWTWAGSPLEYGSQYQISATAIDYQGRPTSQDLDFTTVEPSKFFRAEISPSNGESVGVGMPITVNFTKKVTDRAAVEAALEVQTPTPVYGAWAWTNDRTVEFRPQDLWPGDMPVVVRANLAGVEAQPGVFGRENTEAAFTFRPSVVSVVDADTHTMEVFRAGELINTIPITTGKPGFETRSGTKVLLSKERVRVMDAATGGTSLDDPEYYRVEAPYAMRMTYSGEFVHGAPWSVASQGRDNVSHGCVGMSVSNAEWWWNENNIGDVVNVKNTSVTHTNDGNGLTVWNEPWNEWLARSATGAHYTAPIGASPKEAPIA